MNNIEFERDFLFEARSSFVRNDERSFSTSENLPNDFDTDEKPSAPPLEPEPMLLEDYQTDPNAFDSYEPDKPKPKPIETRFTWITEEIETKDKPPSPKIKRKKRPSRPDHLKPLLSERDDESKVSRHCISMYYPEDWNFCDGFNFFIGLLVAIGVWFGIIYGVWSLMEDSLKSGHVQIICPGFVSFRSDTICIIALGEVSMGIIAIGQVAIGIIAIGQVSLSMLCSLGQLCLSGGYVYVSQLAYGAIIHYNQVAVALVWTTGKTCGYVCQLIFPFFKEKAEFVIKKDKW
eukprot:TRINITY_DN1112_c0_g1_i1.p1 TRINITY_DN1112_c0_g1~~TRINITY_DN1112_c0_g1_i1.p1  ORF type:complete len:290 (-),score=63.85 TRINITY_DN1112_c0_g1_i1:609-1478(-)